MSSFNKVMHYIYNKGLKGEREKECLIRRNLYPVLNLYEQCCFHGDDLMH